MTKSISLVNSFFVNDMEIIIAEKPTISSVLKTLLPTTFPTLISALPSRALKKLTTNSGMLVPIATTVRPITISLTFHLRAMLDAPSVNLSAPQITIEIPIKSKMMSRNIRYISYTYLI